MSPRSCVSQVSRETSQYLDESASPPRRRVSVKNVQTLVIVHYESRSNDDIVVMFETRPARRCGVITIKTAADDWRAIIIIRRWRTTIQWSWWQRCVACCARRDRTNGALRCRVTKRFRYRKLQTSFRARRRTNTEISRTSWSWFAFRARARVTAAATVLRGGKKRDSTTDRYPRVFGHVCIVYVYYFFDPILRGRVWRSNRKYLFVFWNTSAGTNAAAIYAETNDHTCFPKYRFTVRVCQIDIIIYLLVYVKKKHDFTVTRRWNTLR